MCYLSYKQQQVHNIACFNSVDFSFQIKAFYILNKKYFTKKLLNDSRTLFCMYGVLN